MNKTHLQTYTSFRHHLRTLSLSGLLLCIFLLSACSGATTQSTTTTSASNGLVPAGDLTLQNGGNVQLQAYQQWIALTLPLYCCINAIHCWYAWSCTFPSFCSVRSTAGTSRLLAVVVVVLWVVAPLHALSKKIQSKSPLSDSVRK